MNSTTSQDVTSSHIPLRGVSCSYSLSEDTEVVTYSQKTLQGDAHRQETLHVVTRRYTHKKMLQVIHTEDVISRQSLG